jgi:hypothetical protein
MTVESDGAVRHEVLVALPPDEAFWLFAELDRIKPREHNMLAVPIERTVLDLSRTSEVEVTFTAASDGRTRVTLVHRHLDRHGSGWESVQAGVDDDEGWPLYLQRYEDLARREKDNL